MSDKMPKTIIIGAGFSGLYSAYSLKDSLVIGNKDPALFSKMNDSYIVLRYDERIRWLLSKLGINYKKQKLKILYLYQGKLYSRPTHEMIEVYTEKAYGKLPDKIFYGYSINSYDICDVKYSELIDKLYSNVSSKVLVDTVTSVDINNKKVKTASGKEFGYQYLISTIPLNIFLEIAGINNTIKFGSVPLWVYKSQYPRDKFTQILVIDKESTILRYLHGADDIAFFEASAKQENYLDPDGNKEPYIYLKNGKIFRYEDSHELEEVIADLETNHDVYMVGRFAEWKPHYDTEDVISRVNEVAYNIATANITEAYWV